jgi:hypothetical protein
MHQSNPCEGTERHQPKHYQGLTQAAPSRSVLMRVVKRRSVISRHIKPGKEKPLP